MIVVDDGSTDGTAAVVRRFEEVQLVQQANGGLSCARNRAVAVSTGDFVVLLDADDEFLPRKLEATRRWLEEDPDLDIVTSDATVSATRTGTAAGTPTSRGSTSPTSGSPSSDGSFIFVAAAVRRTALGRRGGLRRVLRLPERGRDLGADAPGWSPGRASYPRNAWSTTARTPTA